MTSIDNQIGPRHETSSLTEKEDDWSSEFVGRGESLEHGSAKPFFLEVGTSGQEVVCHGRSNISWRERLCDFVTWRY
jgi:hypothetical protein